LVTLDMADGSELMADLAGVYVGTLRHRRLEPVPHAFRYPLFMVLLDIDRIDELMAVSPFTSRNRFNWATFADRDHFGDPRVTLRERVRRDAESSGIALPDGPIYLLTHLRYLGYCFNPLSLFYCFDRGGQLQAVLGENHNTFGGRHNYWLQPDGSSGLSTLNKDQIAERGARVARRDDRECREYLREEQRSQPGCPAREVDLDQRGPATRQRSFRARAAKALYVSPFMEPDLDYTFALSPPAESLTVHMQALRDGRSFFDATLALERRPWTAPEIRRALVRHPAMTINVIAGIHWEAAKLWWKGVPVVPRTGTDEALTLYDQPTHKIDLS
jgi:uncharacterized protein